jgi:hypothetical protein
VLGRRQELSGTIRARDAVAAVALSMVRNMIGRLSLHAGLAAHSEANLLAELAGLSGDQ